MHSKNSVVISHGGSPADEELYFVGNEYGELGKLLDIDYPVNGVGSLILIFENARRIYASAVYCVTKFKTMEVFPDHGTDNRRN